MNPTNSGWTERTIDPPENRGRPWENSMGEGHSRYTIEPNDFAVSPELTASSRRLAVPALECGTCRQPLSSELAPTSLYGWVMIPESWREHRRGDDHELLGYIDELDDMFQARTLFGFPLGRAGDERDAEQLLDSLGLSYLAERWLLTIDGREDPITVQIAETNPAVVTLRSADYGYEGDYGTPFTLVVPVSPTQLRPERPIA